MYILDTDAASNYLDKRRNNPALRARIDAQVPGTVFISIITVEELLKGILALLNSARKHPRNAHKLIQYYNGLLKLTRDLTDFATLPYDEYSEAQFQKVPANIRTRCSQDCQIAAIAAKLDYIVVTSNAQDYDKIGIARHVDWMSEQF